MSSLVQKANDLFNKRQYKEAKEIYETLSDLYGDSIFKVNIYLCDKEKYGKNDNRVTLSSASFIENLEKEIISLKQIIEEKNVNISERFNELAILTRMLEAYDAKVASSI